MQAYVAELVHSVPDLIVATRTPVLVISQAAMSAPIHTRSTAQTAVHTLASTAASVGGKPDLVGVSGPQDEFARKLYQPGHTVGVGGR